MPSPIAHSSVFWLLWPVMERGSSRPFTRREKLVLGGTLLFTLNAPDLDVVPHVVRADFEFTGHLGPTHTLIAAIIGPTIIAAAVRSFIRISTLRLWLILVLAWVSHLLLDSCTGGRGVMYFWPLWNERFSLPQPIFTGVPHSSPTDWIRYLQLVLTEIPFAGLMWLSGYVIRRSFPATSVAAEKKSLDARGNVST